MPSISNTERALRIECLLRSHGELQGEASSDAESAVEDLLTDLRHYCRAREIDLATCLERSAQIYQTEEALQ